MCVAKCHSDNSCSTYAHTYISFKSVYICSCIIDLWNSVVKQFFHKLPVAVTAV